MKEAISSTIIEDSFISGNKYPVNVTVVIGRSFGFCVIFTPSSKRVIL